MPEESKDYLNGDRIERDFHIDDPLFGIICDSIERSISEGQNPAGAAANAGLSKKKYDRWLENEFFSDWLATAVAKYQQGKLRRDIFMGSDSDELTEKDRLKIKMDLLKASDPTFGVKRVEMNDTRGAVPDPSGEHLSEDQEVMDVLAEADMAANGTPTEPEEDIDGRSDPSEN